MEMMSLFGVMAYPDHVYVIDLCNGGVAFKVACEELSKPVDDHMSYNDIKRMLVQSHNDQLSAYFRSKRVS